MNLRECSLKTIEIISSKSDAHRGIICSSLAKIFAEEMGSSCNVIYNETSEDIEATKVCMDALLSSEERTKEGVDLYCNESGSTLRFLLPIVGALGIRGIFHTSGRLSRRPLSPLYEELSSHGMRISSPGTEPLVTEGKLESGEYSLPGDVSSQFVSGLLFALPLLDGDSIITVKGEFQSKGYADMTMFTIRKFGIKVYEESGESPIRTVYRIPGNQRYIAPLEYRVEGDWSNAAFWFAAGLLGKDPVKILGLNIDSPQGDKRIVDVIKSFGGEITYDESDGGFIAFPSDGKLRGASFDAAQIPDMIPVVALIATQAQGITNIRNASRLRIKESDRLNSIAETLGALGADIEELEDGLIIRGEGRKLLAGAKVNSFNDHRIAMMAAIASLVCEEVSLEGSAAVKKSYPNFFEKFRELGFGNNLELL